MSDIYLATVSCDGVTVAGRQPPAGGVVFAGAVTFAVVATRIFWAYDLASDGTPRGLLVARVDLRNSFIPYFGPGAGAGGLDFANESPTAIVTSAGLYYEWETVYSFQYNLLPPPFAGSPNPFLGHPIEKPLGGGLWASTDIEEADLQNGANFLAGGTLTIEKDFGGSQFIFTTPLGGLTVPFSWLTAQDYGAAFDYTPLDTPLIAGGIGHALAYSDQSLDSAETAKWFDFYTKKNGLITSGAHLSAADPLAWLITDQEGWLPPDNASYWTFLNTGGTPIPEDNGQEPTRFRTRSLSPAGFFYEATQDALKANLGAGSLAATRLPEHGPILAAQINTAAPDTIRSRITYDSGRTWLLGVIFQQASTNNDSPTLAWNGQRLYAVWHDAIGAQILQSNSQDLAATWSMPVALAITGTNPFLLVDPRHGLQYYFYLDGSFNLQLVRSADFGQTFIDGSPHLVATTIGQQTIAAEFSSDGSLLVGYIVAGAWTQRRSKDLGLTWS